MTPDLLREMLLAIAVMLGDGVTRELPEVQFRSESEVHAICGGLCSAIYQYPVITLTDRLDLTNIGDLGILYHELVHHHQEIQERYGDHDSCSRWNYREREAFELQEQWYREHGLARSSPRIFKRC